MAGTLYTFPNSFQANKILITAQYSGHSVTVAPDFVAGETDKSAQFLKKFPLGKVPAYESVDIKLFETNGISYYVGNEQTRGGNSEAEVLQWIGFADNSVLPHACTWVYPTQGILQYNKQSTEKAKSDLKAALQALNEHLSTRTYMVGERISQADISLACTMQMLYETVLDPSFRQPFTNVTRWFVTLVNQPEFKKVLGDVKLCEKMAEFDTKKYNEIHGKGGKKEKGGGSGGGGDNKKKSPKPKEQPQLAAAPVEKKDPWANQPETKFDFDAFKRFYSNNDPEPAIKYFWEHFDKENCSIWQGTYVEDLKGMKIFQVSNLIGGMFQRLDKLRKYAFASSCVLGEHPLEGQQSDYKIDSVWFWRGHGLPFELCRDWDTDYESYKWTKLDPDDEAARKKIYEYFAWEGEFDGRKFQQGKIYK